MMSLRLPSAILIALLLGACAAPNPTRVNVSMMGIKAHGDTTTFTARSGDNLYKIAEYFKVDTRALIDKNNLAPPYTLSSGQVLRIPPPAIVQAKEGDTVFSIARAYNSDQSEIVRMNDLSPPYRLARGQEIRLPSTNTGTPNTQITAVTEDAASIANPVVTSQDLSGPISTTESANGNKMHRSAAGTIVEQDLKPPPGATQGNQKLGETKVASLPAATAPTPSAPFGKASKPSLGAGTPAFAWPVNGSTLSGYGPKAGGRHNDGINIGAPLGSPVRTAAAGEVVYTGDNVAGFGNLILVRHSGGFATAYAHVQKPLVTRGEKVTAGQAIAQVGKSGNVSTPQLHFEIRKGTQAVNPQPYLP